MKLRNLFPLLLAAVLLTAACSAYSAAPAVPAAVGSWNMTIETPLGTQTPTLVVSGDATALSATMISPDGELELTEIAWAEDGSLGFAMDIEAAGQQLHLVFSGTVDGDSISGAFSSDFGDMTATATRVVE